MSKSARSQSLAESLGASAYPHAAEVMRLRGGLVFSPPRRKTVESALGRVMLRIDVTDPESFAACLAESGSIFDEVMALVTVGETYFFREPAQFAFLRQHVLPELRDQARAVRMWSAACATGEEAYSLAITADEAGVPWSVVGTDISRARLAAARRGRYREWSMRGVDSNVIGRYFTRVDREYAITGEFRRDLKFTYLNLAGSEYPSPSGYVHDLDVIFCRNVLIYFDPETIARVATRLLESLSPDGYVFLGASDPPLAELIECGVVQTPSGFVYRRASAEKSRRRGKVVVAPAQALTRSAAPPKLQSSASSTPQPHLLAFPVVAGQLPADHRRATDIEVDKKVVREIDVLRAASTRKEHDRAAALGQEMIDRGEDTAEVMLLTIRSLADLGRLRDAERVCAAALDRHGDVAELRSLMATLLLHSGHARAAATEARRAIYLDRTLDTAYLVLADALAKLGDVAAARQALTRAERVLGSGQLRAAARARLKQLREAQAHE